MENFKFSDEFLNIKFLNSEPKPTPPNGFRMFKLNIALSEIKFYSQNALPENSAMLSPDLYDKILKYFEDKCKGEVL
jgi:hypothetical protein